MNKVWIVKYTASYDPDDIVEVFGSEQSALSYIAKRKAESRGFSDAEGYYVADYDVL